MAADHSGRTLQILPPGRDLCHLCGPPGNYHFKHNRSICLQGLIRLWLQQLCPQVIRRWQQFWQCCRRAVGLHNASRINWQRRRYSHLHATGNDLLVVSHLKGFMLRMLVIMWVGMTE